MRFAETPNDVRARWGRRHTSSALDSAQFHRDLDAAERRLCDEPRPADPEKFEWPLRERCRHALRWMKPFATMRSAVISANRMAGRWST